MEGEKAITVFGKSVYVCASVCTLVMFVSYVSLLRTDSTKKKVFIVLQSI